MHILFLSQWYPYPPDNGSKLRIHTLLQGLATCHDVSLLSFAEQPNVAREGPSASAFCGQVEVVPWKPFNPSSWRARLGFLSTVPRSIVDTYSPQMAHQVEDVLARQDYDLVIASQLGMANYIRHFHQVPALFEEVEVSVLYEQFSHAASGWGRVRHGMTWAKHKSYLAHVARRFRACTVVSDRERQLLTRAVPGYEPVEVIPNCVDLASYQGIATFPKPDSLIFTGSFRYLANYDAMTWFLREVYPHIRRHAPGVRLTITGDDAGLPLPPTNGVKRAGFVNDVRPLLASAAVSLAPIRVGGGTRLKILEAMALRTPVVSTSKGAEGLAVKSGDHILIADTPRDFAHAVLTLLGDPALRRRLVDNAYQLVYESYNWSAVMPRFLQVAESAAHG